MAFIAHTHDNGEPKPFEWKAAGAGLALVCGTALTMTDGVLALATGAALPTYIAETDIEATTAGQAVPVTRVADDVIYETQLSVDSASIAEGAAYTIDATGNKITATTGGACEVVAFDTGKTASGDFVRIRFVTPAPAESST
jgi:hypothetical protein